MKLLLDQNLSPHLVKQLADIYPQSVHVQSLGLDCSSDEEVWTAARDAGYMIVTKDADFSERSILLGFPPKVVWIRRGNCSTSEIEKILREHFEDIKALNGDEQKAVLEIF